MVPPPVRVAARSPRNTFSSSAICSINIERAAEIEDIDRRNLARIHLHELVPDGRRRRAWSRNPAGCNSGADQPLPSTRRRKFAQHGAGAAADLKASARLGKEFIGEADDQFAARDKPEVPGFQFGKFVGRSLSRIDAGMDGVGKLGRKHRNAIVLVRRRHARRRNIASPAARLGLVRGNRRSDRSQQRGASPSGSAPRRSCRTRG